MKKAELNKLIGVAKEKFIAKVPASENWVKEVLIYVASDREKDKLFKEVTNTLHAREKELLTDTVGEVIAGDGKYAILLYQSAIRSPEELDLVLWHELGHICSSETNREIERECLEDAVNKVDSPIRSGGAVWMEFIADAIATYVAEAKPVMQYALMIQDYMTEMVERAINNGVVCPDVLGHYCSFLLTNPIVQILRRKDSKVVDGLGYCRPEVAQAILACAETLEKQLKEEPFWKISRDRIIELGEAFDILWDECHVERARTLFGKCKNNS